MLRCAHLPYLYLLMTLLAHTACDDSTAMLSSPSKVPIPVVDPVPEPFEDLPAPDEPEHIPLSG